MNIRIASEGECVEIQTAVISSLPEAICGWHVSHKLCIQGYVLRIETERSETSSSASRTKKDMRRGMSFPAAPSCSLKDSTESVFKIFQDQAIRMHSAKVGMCSRESSPQSFHQNTISTGWTIVSCCLWISEMARSTMLQGYEFGIVYWRQTWRRHSIIIRTIYDRQRTFNFVFRSTEYEYRCHGN